MRAGVAALVVALLASVGYAALDAVDVVPGVLTSDLGSEDDVPPAPPSESTSQPTSVPPGGSGARGPRARLDRASASAFGATAGRRSALDPHDREPASLFQAAPRSSYGRARTFAP